MPKSRVKSPTIMSDIETGASPRSPPCRGKRDDDPPPNGRSVSYAAGPTDDGMASCVSALCCARNIGNMTVCLSDTKGRPYLVIGPYFCCPLMITAPIVYLPPLLFGVFVNWDGGLSMWIYLLYALEATITLLSLAAVGCGNPGLVEKDSDRGRPGRGGER